MEYNRLGLTDLRVSRVGFGCWALGGHPWGPVDDKESIAAIRRAMELGVNLFDTSDVYGFGHSEEILALGLGDERKRVVIATKFGVKWDDQGRISRDISPRSVVQSLEDSMRRLRIDCVPLYQINWPDGKTPISDALEALRRCQEAGKIRYIGCCNFSPDQIREAWDTHHIDALQAPYNVMDRSIEETIRPVCEELGISLLTYSSLAHGLFAGKFTPDVRFGKEDIRSRSVYFQDGARTKNFQAVNLLTEIGKRYQKTPAQVAIRWILDSPGITCALTGIKTSAQTEENVGALAWKLSQDDWQLLAKFNGHPSESPAH
jgi:aryl-alcohol dehydrogenase-like predicted oxidoreductase